MGSIISIILCVIVISLGFKLFISIARQRGCNNGYDVTELQFIRRSLIAISNMPQGEMKDKSLDLLFKQAYLSEGDKNKMSEVCIKADQSLKQI